MKKDTFNISQLLHTYIFVLKVGSNLLVCFLNCLCPQFQLLLIAVFILQDLKTESIIVFLIKIYVDLLKNCIKILM